MHFEVMENKMEASRMSTIDEQLMTVRQLADYLQMNERTVLKLVNAGTLPGAKIASQWRFKRSVIDSWLVEQMGGQESSVPLAEVPLAEVPVGDVPLGDLLEDRGILMDVRAKDRIGAIEELAQRSFANGWVLDKHWFVGAIVEREALASTAMEGGVAFLHTRHQNATKIARPFIVLGRSWAGVDFGAPDSKPTHLFFHLGLKHD